VTEGAQERVHAVLRLDPGTDLDAIVRAANTALEDHQRVRTASAWTDGDLPRTEGTRKLKRAAIREWVRSGQRPVTASGGHTVEALLERFSHGRPVSETTTIEELGLSSLERVELMVALEDRFQSRVDESRFAQAASVADLKSLLAAPGPDAEPVDDPVDFPTWNRTWPVWLVRRLSQATWILPLARVFAHTRVEGQEHLRAIRGPVVFASNHQSHFDVPVILSALPGRLRARVAPAMAKEFFKAHFFPAGYSRRERLSNSLNYYLAAFFFNAFPLPQREAGARQTLQYIGELSGRGWSVLIFPEGMRSQSGEIKPFRGGIGMIGARLDIPVIPVRLDGIDRILPTGSSFARPARVRVAFGAPLTLHGDDYSALAKQVEDAVRAL
jgi:long-chain acyl-CoA synthetase